MTEEMVANLASEAIKTTIFLAGPMLAAALVIGLMVSIFQALTQINEATLTFIPKMIAVVAVMTVMGPWMMEVLQHYAVSVLGGAWEWVR